MDGFSRTHEFPAPEVGKLQTGPLGLDSDGTPTGGNKSEIFKAFQQYQTDNAENMARRAAERMREWQRPSK